MKRAPGAKRGEGKFVRISWDEALTTIADKMKEIREKYGPYSIMVPKGPNTDGGTALFILGSRRQYLGLFFGRCCQVSHCR